MGTIYLPRTRPHQLAVLTDPSRFKVVACGRRWGKTDVGLQATVQGHGPTRAALRGAIDGGDIAWVVPVSTNAAELWGLLKRACREAGTANEQRKKLTIHGAGSIRVLSTDDPNNLRSPGFDGMVLDEAAFMKDGVWGTVLRPMLVDRVGWAMFLTTFNGPNWFVRDVWNPADGRAGWKRWRLPTNDNPFIDASELHEAYLDMGPHRFAQEHGAEIMAQEGAEFPPEWFTDDIRFDDWPPASEYVLRVMALDPSMGRTDKSDYSAWVTLKLDFGGTMWIDCDMQRRDPRQIVRDGIEIARTVVPDAVGIETNGFQHIMAGMIDEDKHRLGVPLPVVEITNTGSEKDGGSKLTRIRKLVPFLSRKEMRFKRTRGANMLLEQLQSFPVGDHDDGPDALEMALRITRAMHAELMVRN